MVKDPTRTRSALKREAILEAAAHEFRDSGFAATSMDRIAERAGVSKRTVYNHFESKDLLFEAILELLWARAHAQTALAYDPNAALEPQLRSLAAQQLDSIADPNAMDLARVLLSEAIRNPTLVRRVWEDFSRREAGLALWIRAAAADRRLAVDDPKLAANQFSALLKAEAFWPQLVASLPAPSGKDRRDLIEATISIFLAHYSSPCHSTAAVQPNDEGH